MTHEEALYRVKGYLTDVIPIKDYSEVEEIVKALEQEPCKVEVTKLQQAYNKGVEDRRQAVLDTISELNVISFYEAQEDSKECYYEIRQAVENMQPVTPQQKYGKWILLDECANSGYYCSNCQKKLVKEGWSNTVKKIKYCPNCGCRMVEPQESYG